MPQTELVSIRPLFRDLAGGVVPRPSQPRDRYRSPGRYDAADQFVQHPSHTPRRQRFVALGDLVIERVSDRGVGRVGSFDLFADPVPTVDVWTEVDGGRCTWFVKSVPCVSLEG